MPLSERRHLLELPPDSLLARPCRSQSLRENRTSGSTGRYLSIWRTPFEEYRVHARFLAEQIRYGLRPWHRRAEIRGAHTAPHPTSWAGLFVQQSIGAALSPAEQRLQLLACRADVLGGYAGALARLAPHWTPADRAQSPFLFVTAGAEKLHPGMREQIETAFGAPLYERYGANELGIFAYQCRRASHLHLDPWLSYVEVGDGSGAAGEVLATALHSRAMPFVRMRLGDHAVAGPSPCPDCGAPLRTIARVEGRTLDVFHIPGRAPVLAATLLNPILGSRRWIRQFQLVQISPAALCLYVVGPDGDWPALTHELAAAWGPDVKIHVEAVESLSPDAHGKFRVYQPLPQ